MNIKNKKPQILFFASVFFMFFMSLSLMFASPASDKAFNDNSNTPLIVCGLMFWVSFIFAYVFYIILSIDRRKNEKKHYKGLPGIIKFFSNPAARIVDIITIIVLVVLIVCLFTKKDSSVSFVMIFLSVFFVQMHCIFNGKNYKYIKSQNKRRELE